MRKRGRLFRNGRFGGAQEHGVGHGFVQHISRRVMAVHDGWATGGDLRGGMGRGQYLPCATEIFDTVGLSVCRFESN